MVGDICSLLVVLVLCTLWVMVRWAERHQAQLHRSSATAFRQRMLKPRPVLTLPPVSVEKTEAD